jgi:hypothetical protein
MPEDLPVTKWINVMLGILRSKVISERKQVYGVIFGSSSGMFVSGQRGGRDRERERDVEVCKRTHIRVFPLFL